MPCFPPFDSFLEFQAGHVAFDGTIYYIFIFETIRSSKPHQRFLKGHLYCISQPKPRNNTFVIESGGVLS